MTNNQFSVMELFNTAKQFFILLCILPTKENTVKWITYLRIVFTFATIIIIPCSIIANMCFIVKYSNSDLQSCLHALYSVTGVLPAVYSFFVFLILRRKVVYVIDEFQRIYDLSKVFHKS